MTIRDLEYKLFQLPYDSEVCLPAAIETSCFGRFDISQYLPLKLYQHTDLITREKLRSEELEKTLQKMIWKPARRNEIVQPRHYSTNDYKPFTTMLYSCKAERIPIVVYLENHHVGGVNFEARPDGKHVVYDVTMFENAPLNLRRRVFSTPNLFEIMWHPDTNLTNIIAFPCVERFTNHKK